MGVGLVLFWPAMFMIKGNDEKTAELARVRGEMEAIQQASIEKNCGIQFEAPKPAEEKAPKPAIETRRSCCCAGPAPAERDQSLRSCSRHCGAVLQTRPPNPSTAAATRSSSVATTTASTPRASEVRA